MSEAPRRLSGRVQGDVAGGVRPGIREVAMTGPCPKCGGAADAQRNPERFTLPIYRGTCRDCGHEWDFNPTVNNSRCAE